MSGSRRPSRADTGDPRDHAKAAESERGHPSRRSLRAEESDATFGGNVGIQTSPSFGGELFKGGRPAPRTIGSSSKRGHVRAVTRRRGARESSMTPRGGGTMTPEGKGRVRIFKTADGFAEGGEREESRLDGSRKEGRERRNREATTLDLESN